MEEMVGAKRVSACERTLPVVGAPAGGAGVSRRMPSSQRRARSGGYITSFAQGRITASHLPGPHPAQTRI